MVLRVSAVGFLGRGYVRARPIETELPPRWDAWQRPEL